MRLLFKKINDFAQQIINNWVVSFVLLGLSVFLYGTLNTLSLNEPKYRELVSGFVWFPVILGIVSFLIFLSVGSDALMKYLSKPSVKNKHRKISPWFITTMILLITLGYLMIQSQPGLVSAILKGLTYKQQITPTPIPIKEIGTKQILLTEDLKIGNSGNEVKILQAAFVSSERLNKNQVTGYYGNLTSEAVKTFQKDHGLKITGEVNNETKTEFNKTFGIHSGDYYLDLIPPMVYTQPINSISASSDTDPIVNCRSNGCPDIKIKQSECSHYVCCETRSKNWVWTQSNSECESVQNGGVQSGSNNNQASCQRVSYTTTQGMTNGTYYCCSDKVNEISRFEQQIQMAEANANNCYANHNSEMLSCMSNCGSDNTCTHNCSEPFLQECGSYKVGDMRRTLSGMLSQYCP